MPYHHIVRAHLHEDIHDIERQGEIIVQVLPDLASTAHMHVFTRFAGQEFIDANVPMVTR